MNCEKCKTRKATLFYADDSGVRHALCASCGTAVGKLGKIEFEDKQAGAEYSSPPFIVPQDELSPAPLLLMTDSAPLSCPHCSHQFSALTDSGKVGCPYCFDAFASALPILTTEICRGARMPISRRLADEKKRAVAEYKSRIRIAVSEENYELAAALRDKIRALEGK
jgi:protein arginine kinase activator